jgi:uncharacterized protein (DUF342 family)
MVSQKRHGDDVDVDLGDQPFLGDFVQHANVGDSYVIHEDGNV